jgi:hypothetical protein
MLEFLNIRITFLLRATHIIQDGKHSFSVNAKLVLMVRKAYDMFEMLKYGGLPFTIGELTDKIIGKEERPTLLMDYLE